MDGKKTSGITPPKSNWAEPIETPPFSGFPMTAQVKFTFGGLKVDPDGRVLNTNEEPIPGLYAAGEITGLYHKHPPATSVLRANTFGRIVGTTSPNHSRPRQPDRTRSAYRFWGGRAFRPGAENSPSPTRRRSLGGTPGLVESLPEPAN